MKGDDIAERLLNFAAEVLRLVRRLPDDPAAKHIARQLMRSSTGAGANDEEARGAESRADFVHKVSIATKEMRESLYWLRLSNRADLVGEGQLEGLVDEANQLVAILTASARTAKGAK